jgi:hypothetical protein
VPNNRVRKSRNAELLKFATYERIDRQLIAFAFDLEDLSSEVAELASSAVPNYTGRIQSPGGCRSVNPYEGALFFTRKFRTHTLPNPGTLALTAGALLGR